MANSAWEEPDDMADNSVEEGRGGLCGCATIVIVAVVVAAIWLGMWCCSGPS